MKIIEVKKNKDGSARMTYELDLQEFGYFRDLARKQKVKFDKEFINKTMLIVLHQKFENDTKNDLYQPPKKVKKGKK